MVSSGGAQTWQSIASVRQRVASASSSFATLLLVTKAMLIVGALSCQRDNQQNRHHVEVQEQTCGENYTLSVDGSPQNFCMPENEASARHDCSIFFFNYSLTQQALLIIESLRLNTTIDMHSGAGSQCIGNPSEVFFSGTKSSELCLWVNKSFSLNYSYLQQILTIKRPAAILVRSAAVGKVTNICNLTTGMGELIVDSSVYVYASNAIFHDIQPNDIQCHLSEYNLTLNGSLPSASLNLTVLAAPLCNSSWTLLIGSQRSCKGETMYVITGRSVTVQYKLSGIKPRNPTMEHSEGFTLWAISSDTILARDSSISSTVYEGSQKRASKSYSMVIVTVSLTGTLLAVLAIALTSVLILRHRRQSAGSEQFGSQPVIPNANIATAPTSAENEEILMADNSLYATQHAS